MSDGVFALATPVGRSAVAVVRVSGLVLPEKLIRAPVSYTHLTLPTTPYV